MINLLLTGDIATYNLGKSSVSEIITDASDAILANLEGPLCDNSLSPSKKAGPLLRGSVESISDFADARYIFSLANNHIMDYGTEGLMQTSEHCQKLGVRTIGAGNNYDEASAPVIIEKEEVKVAIIATGDIQFGIAGQNRSGIFSAQDPHIYSMVSKLRKECDHVIVSIHAGAEMTPWPSPRTCGFYKSLIDAGATVIHGHHPHVPQGFEEYGAGVIFYGLGNFLVNKDRWSGNDEALWSLVVCLSLSKNGEFQFDTAPVEIKEKDSVHTVAICHHDVMSKRREYLELCNMPLSNENLLEGLWQEFSFRQYTQHYGKWLRFNYNAEREPILFLCRKLLVSIKEALIGQPSTIPFRPGRDLMLTWYHLFACRTHSHSISTALGLLSGAIDDVRTDKVTSLVNNMMPWSREGDGNE